MKVIRILEYEGSEDWVKKTLEKSQLQPGLRVHFGHKKTIKCTQIKDNEIYAIVEAKE